MSPLLKRSLLLVTLLVTATCAGITGCASSGVGDPCNPENVPAGGFSPLEAYLEQGSVQCRTRTCVAYKLDGDPNQVIEDGTCRNPDECVSKQELEDRVYCTCRCRALEGSSAPTCACPSGYSCTDILEVGGTGLRGGYCIKDGT
ncbi:MAG: hypothetical protein KC543_06520 [Myxococcales bacterium]|nr:hypothetical protein [Myxococcales bacterium]